MKFSEIKWWRKECNDLFFFESVVLSTAWQEKFRDFGPMQHELCDFLDLGKNPSRRKLISADRHSFKSTVGLGFLIWLFCWNLVKKETCPMEYNTATQDNAEIFYQDFWFTLNECDLLHAIFGDVLPSNERGYTKRTKKRVQVGEVLCDFSSFEEQQVMRHYKVIFNDDLENDKNVRTEAGREDTKNKWKMQKSIISKSKTKNTGLEIDQGTPYHYQGLMWELITKKKSYDKFIRACIEGWPNVSIADIKNRTKPLTDPINKSYEDLLETLDDQGANIFSPQYLIKPMSDEGSLCPAEWMTYYEKGPSVFYRTMVWDLGGSDPKLHDATGITVVDTDLDGVMYVRLAEEIYLSPHELMTTLKKYIDLWKPDDTRLEREKYAITIGDFFEHEFPLMNIGFLSHKKQENAIRIWAMRPYLQKKKIRIQKDMHELEDYLLQYPQTRLDDMLTSLAYHLDIRQLPEKRDDDQFKLNVEKTFEVEFDKFMQGRQQFNREEIDYNDKLF